MLQCATHRLYKMTYYFKNRFIDLVSFIDSRKNVIYSSYM